MESEIKRMEHKVFNKKGRINKMTTKTLQTLLRRRGFYIIVGLLYDYPDGFTLKDLRIQLTERKAHYNNYLRVREMLLKIKLITYFLDKKNRKNIKLTDLGRSTWAKMSEISNEVDEK